MSIVLIIHGRGKPTIEFLVAPMAILYVSHRSPSFGSKVEKKKCFPSFVIYSLYDFSASLRFAMAYGGSITDFLMLP